MNKADQKKLLIEIMQQDEKDGLYYNKAEQDFEEWYHNKYHLNPEYGETIPFYYEVGALPIEFRWGVYQKFFEEKGIVTLSKIHHKKWYCGYDVFETPQEAIDKANELYNERKDGNN